jgi:hypothetical protein
MSYLQIYQQHRAELLKERRNDAYSASVFTTSDLAFTRVEVSNPVAADLLRLCAFLAPEVIPEELLTQGITVLGLPFSSITADALSLNAAIEILLTHSLLTRYPQDRLLGMHVWSKQFCVRACQHTSSSNGCNVPSRQLRQCIPLNLILQTGLYWSDCCLMHCSV